MKGKKTNYNSYNTFVALQKRRLISLYSSWIVSQSSKGVLEKERRAEKSERNDIIPNLYHIKLKAFWLTLDFYGMCFPLWWWGSSFQDYTDIFYVNF